MDVGELGGLLCLPRLREDLDRVEATMVGSVEANGSLSGLAEAGLRVVKGGGKRLRPVLSLAAAALPAAPDPAAPDPGEPAGGTAAGVGSPGDCPTLDRVIDAAASVELVQVGSLVHDDLMDHAASRRGVATVNSAEGVNWAVLVGDHLLAMAGMAAARVSAEVAMALASTIADLANGQALEVASAGDGRRTIDEYLASIRGKTASLFRCSLRVGALAGGLDPERVEAVSRFGECFGMGFQIIDDVLDVVASSELLGKPVGNDVREGVFTLPVLLACEEGVPGLVERLGDHADPVVAEQINELVRGGGQVARSLDTAERYHREGAEALAVFGDHPVAKGLAALPDRYLEWSLTRAGVVRGTGR